MASRLHSCAFTVPLVVLVIACGPVAGPASSPTMAASTSGPSAQTTTPSTAPSTPVAGQTDTAWGRIWDTVPADFPVAPGATPAEDAGGEPVSARFAVEGGDPLAVATLLQDALEQATFSTLGLNGPGEDGGYVIDSTGEGDCRIQTAIAPLGDMTFVSVLYGSGCPAP